MVERIALGYKTKLRLAFAVTNLETRLTEFTASFRLGRDSLVSFIVFVIDS